MTCPDCRAQANNRITCLELAAVKAHESIGELLANCTEEQLERERILAVHNNMARMLMEVGKMKEFLHERELNL